MNSTFITFVVSGLGIVALLAHKYFEVHKGKSTFFSGISEYTNVHVRKGASVARQVNKQNATRFLGWLIAYSIVLIKKVCMYIQNHTHTQKIADIVSGKSVQKNTDGASIFLKRIREHDRVDTQ